MQASRDLGVDAMMEAKKYNKNRKILFRHPLPKKIRIYYHPY
jgi:hypothetical protein